MENFRAIRRVLWITLGLNLLATAAKLIVGYWTGSLSLIADGFDSVFDSASNVIGLAGIYLAAKPADEDHPYGHRKAETMTTLIIASLLFLTTWELIQSAVERLRDPALIQTEVNVWSFGALLLSIVVHLAVVWYELRAGRRLHSDVLVADALHTRADIFVSLSVIGGLIAVRLGYPLADPILALVIALLIAKIGIDIIRESSPTLMDRVAMPADQVEQIALSVPGVLSCHGVRSRGHEQAVYADLHIQVDPTMSTEQAHAIAHEVQRRLNERRPDIHDVTIHVEPFGPSTLRRGSGQAVPFDPSTRSGQAPSTLPFDPSTLPFDFAQDKFRAGSAQDKLRTGSPPEEPGQEEMTIQIRRLTDGLGLGIHDVWAYEVDGRYYMELHLEADGTLPLRQAHEMASSLEERAHAEIPYLAELTIHIEPQGQLIWASNSGVEEGQVAQAVRQVINDTLNAEACHRVRVRRGYEGWAVSMHCQLPGEISLAEAHRISTRLETRLQEKVPGLERVVIHTEPREE